MPNEERLRRLADRDVGRAMTEFDALLDRAKRGEDVRLVDVKLLREKLQRVAKRHRDITPD